MRGVLQPSSRQVIKDGGLLRRINVRKGNACGRKVVRLLNVGKTVPAPCVAILFGTSHRDIYRNARNGTFQTLGMCNAEGGGVVILRHAHRGLRGHKVQALQAGAGNITHVLTMVGSPRSNAIVPFTVYHREGTFNLEDITSNYYL